MQFSLVPTFFSLVLVICLNWYLHLKLSHDLLALALFNIWRYKFTSETIYLTLWKPNGLSKRLKQQSIWTRPKCKSKVSRDMDSTKVLLRGRLKGYLRYKTITSQNVSSEAQVKNFFYFVEKLCSLLKIFNLWRHDEY